MIEIVEKKEYESNEIKELLLKNNSVLMKSILMLYDKQTEDEKYLEKSNERNNVGFNRFDAPILSKYALIIKRTGGMMINDLYDARSRIIKYTNQITNIVNEKIAKEEGVQLKWKI